MTLPTGRKKNATERGGSIGKKDVVISGREAPH
jgi:hypothetical protein